MTYSAISSTLRRSESTPSASIQEFPAVAPAWTAPGGEDDAGAIVAAVGCMGADRLSRPGEPGRSGEDRRCRRVDGRSAARATIAAAPCQRRQATRQVAQDLPPRHRPRTHSAAPDSLEQVLGHPIAGASWEGHVIETLIRVSPSRTIGSFYRTAAGAEIDLILGQPGRGVWAIEVKLGRCPVRKGGFASLSTTSSPIGRLSSTPGRSGIQRATVSKQLVCANWLRNSRDNARIAGSRSTTARETPRNPAPHPAPKPRPEPRSRRPRSGCSVH